MRRAGRTAIYSFALCAVLAAASFAFYHQPSQATLRLENLLARYFAVPVRVSGCLSDPLGSGVSIDEIAVPASPVVVSANLLVLRGLRGDPPGASRFRHTLERRTDGGALRVPEWRARSAELALESRSTDPLHSPLAGEWNASALLHDHIDLAKVRSGNARIIVDELTLRYATHIGAAIRRWDATFESVEARPSRDDRVVVDGALRECEHWRGGELSVSLGRDGSVQVAGEVDSLVVKPSEGALLGSPWRRLVETLDLHGETDLDIRRVEWGESASFELDVLSSHYDSRLRLGAAELEHIRGTAHCDARGVRFGRYANRPPFEAEVCGITIGLHGHLADGRGEVGARLESTDLRDVSLVCGESTPADGGMVPRLARLIHLAHVDGLSTGELTLRITPEGVGDWTSEFPLRSVTFGVLPFLRAGRGVLHASDLDGRRSLRVIVDEVSWDGLGLLSGELTGSWTDDGFRLAATSIAVRPHGEDASRGTAVLFGESEWAWGGELRSLDLRWTDVEFASELLAATGIAGGIESNGDAIAGEITLGPGTVLGEIVAPRLESPPKPRSEEARVTTETGPADSDTKSSAPLEGSESDGGHSDEPPPLPRRAFERGRAHLVFAANGVEIRSLKLLGPDWTLRAAGTISARGEIELTLVVADHAEYSFRVDALDAAGLDEWEAAAGKTFRIVRLAGRFARPRARIVTQPERSGES